MKRTIMVLVLVLFIGNTFAQGPANDDVYSDYFHAGGMYAQAMGFENNVRDYYDLLKKIEKYEGKEIKEVQEILIRRINGNLNTLGYMIKDIEAGRILSPESVAYIKVMDAGIGKTSEKKNGGEKKSELSVSPDSDGFWETLKQERELKNWKPNFKNEKTNAMLEKDISLALDTLIEYGNIFKIK